MRIERPNYSFWFDLFLMFLWVVAALFMLFSCHRAPAAWGASGCGPVGPKVQATPFTGWREYKGCYYYYRDGRQIAGWEPGAQIFRTCDFDKKVWSEPQEPPWKEKGCGCSSECKCGEACKCKEGKPICPSGGCGPDCPTTASSIGQLPTGVEWDKVPAGEHYSIEGLEVTEAEAEAAVKKASGGGTIPDDASQLRLTVIGTPEECKPVFDDLATNPSLVPYQGKLVLQEYKPTDVVVSPRYGFVTTGHPTIYLQRPDATVVHRQDTYQGPAALATAIRKADPNYDPKKDPDAAKPAPVVPNLPTGAAPLLILAGGAALVYFLAKRKKK